MSDHLVMEPDETLPLIPREDPGNSLCSSSAGKAVNNTKSEQIASLGGEGKPLILAVESRICQEEEDIKNLENLLPVADQIHRKHRLKYGYRSHACSQPYQPGYTAPSPPPRAGEIAINIGGGWTISGTPLDLHDPRLLAIAEAERRFLEAEYDEYAS